MLWQKFEDFGDPFVTLIGPKCGPKCTAIARKTSSPYELWGTY